MTRRALVSALLCLLVWLTSGVRAERLPIKSYGPAEGLPSTFIEQVTRDSRGFLWFATRDGLSRFDGDRFVTYGLEQGLPSPTVNTLIESRSGTYWIGTNGGGVCRMDPAAALTRTTDPNRPLLKLYPMGDGRDQLGNRVNVLFEDRGGRIWAGTDEGIYRLDRPADARGAFTRIVMGYETPAGVEGGVHAILEDSDGTLWFGLGWGLLRYSPDGRRLHYTLRPTRREGDNVFTLLLDGQQRFWLGHQTGLIIAPRLPTDGGTRDGPTPSRPLLAGLASQPMPVDAPITLPAPTVGALVWYRLHTGAFATGVLALAGFPDGHIWLGTTGGLLEFDGARFLRYTTGEGLSDRFIMSLATDGDDNLWAATMAGGAMKLTRRGFRSYDTADGLGDLRVHAIHEDTSGAVVAVTGDWFLHRFDGRRFTRGQPRLAPDAQYPWTSQVGFLDRHDQWWLLTNKTIHRLAPGSPPDRLAGRAPIETFTGLGAGQLYEDRDGNVWMALRRVGEVAQWERRTGRVRLFTAADGYPPVMAAVLGEDRAGNVWIGSFAGDLVRYARGSGSFTYYPAAPAPSGGAITSLHLDPRGRLWAGSSRDGLLRIDDADGASPRITSLTQTAGLSSHNVRSIVSDRASRIYVGTARGVDRLDADGGRVQHYTTVDGLPSGFVSASFRDSRGDLWFGTLRGLARLRPDADDRRTPPLVLIGGLSLAGTPVPIAHVGQASVEGLLLAPEQRQVQIDFFGFAFGMGERLRYRAKLEGLDAEWSPPLDERTIRYSQLAPRTYRFLVKAVSADGTESARPAVVEFTVMPALWRRAWFQGLVAAAVLLAAYVAYRIRVQRLLAFERVRTRIASDLHDDIGATLAQIAVLSEVVQTQIDEPHAPLRAPLSRIAQASREAIASMSDIVWAINPQKDSLRAMVWRMREFANEVLSPRGIAFTLADPADDVPLTADLRRELYLIFKEALNNILRHSDATQVTIDVTVATRSARRLVLRVVDNGRGFDPQAAAEEGNGLGSMRRRAERLRGTFTLTSRPGETAIVVDVPT